MEPTAIEARANGVLLRVRVQPKASRDAVLEACPAYYRIALTAPPVEGAANEALVAFMAHTLGVKKRQVSLAGGAQSRLKSLQIDAVNLAEVRRALDLALG